MMWKHFLVIFGSFYEISDALCCNHGTSPDLAGNCCVPYVRCELCIILYYILAKSCLEVVLLSPGCKDLSGYYWLETTTGSVEQVSALDIVVSFVQLAPHPRGSTGSSSRKQQKSCKTHVTECG